MVSKTKKEGLYNSEVNNICKMIFGKKFLGVYPSDIHPRKQNKRKYFKIIYNLSKHDEEGTHFIAVNKISNKIFYYDPLGEECKNKSIRTFLEQFKVPIIENKIPTQSNTSVFCGIFCIAFLLFSDNTRDRIYYYNVLRRENLSLNDKIVTEIVLKKLEK